MDFTGEGVKEREMSIEWTDIPDFPNYEIMQNGLVRNKTSGIIKHPSMGHRGYPVHSLRKDGRMYLRTVHILLARAFIPNPENKPEVNHIDGDKTNYDLSNLEWCTRWENDNHARRTGLHKSDGDKEVAQYTRDGRLIAIYKSASSASRATGVGRSNICNVANRRAKCKTAKGYVWRWTNDLRRSYPAGDADR